ncbi:type II secretion system protein [Microcella humidisoli]|uniref:Prepilin-type N-terminal cleavage/methylation domain-containing protein n=1 Tax=Microcella humidisoli TaxID=2963406 RepID=A0ABY5FU52_9MICO|nr:prepilin-type N-terminal cleavage/methylation domain-containing protein [Microcella humidisoli]UTT61341.1 prepilin-type N-terminal cleavage/methylation domain-containing protein [Microcella humidisoli]
MRSIRDAGFTLVELVVVMVIIGVLAAIAVPIFLGSLDQARAGALQAALATARLETALVVVEEEALPAGSELDDILDAHGDDDITLAFSGSGTDFCIQGVHALVDEPWAVTQRLAPVSGASCAPDGSLVGP